MKVTGITYEEMRRGCWDPKARLEDMDANWIEASLCFPSFPRFCGQTFIEAKDKELADLCVKAYNDWMVEEWCGDSERPPHPADHHPAVGRRAGRRTRSAATPSAGVHAVCFSEIPPYLGLPSIHDRTDWDPFFARLRRDATPSINMHIGSSSKMPSTSADAPPAVGSTLTFGNAMSLDGRLADVGRARAASPS